jgi:hypothetical protein
VLRGDRLVAGATRAAATVVLFTVTACSLASGTEQG